MKTRGSVNKSIGNPPKPWSVCVTELPQQWDMVNNFVVTVKP